MIIQWIYNFGFDKGTNKTMKDKPQTSNNGSNFMRVILGFVGYQDFIIFVYRDSSCGQIPHGNLAATVTGYG